jgi:hypothetical protein
MALPTNGQVNWGTPLTAQITADEAAAATVANSLANHLINNPADPHGDRAFATGLVLPITTGTNAANGYVKCDGTGHIPAGLLPSAGGTNNWYDVRNSSFGATGSGTVDDSTAINAALAAASAAGSGVVWVPAGRYGLGSPLVIGNGTLLLLAPGAIMQRISPVSAPTVMLQNYAPGVSASTGNFTIMGGEWDAVGSTNQTSTNTIFSFVNAGQVIIENTILNQVANGNSPYGQFFGCTNVTAYGVTLTATAPTCTRAGALNPCWRVEQTHATNISGLVAGDYNHQMCSNINIINVTHSGLTSSDSQGTFSAWHSLIGTIGFIDSAALFHTNILVNLCNATAFANTGIYGYNWNQVVFTGCNFNNPAIGQSFTQVWVSSAPTPIVWTTSNNDQNGLLVAAGTLVTTLSTAQTSCSQQVYKGYTYHVKGWALCNGSDITKHFKHGLGGATCSSSNLSLTIITPTGLLSLNTGVITYGTLHDCDGYTPSGQFILEIKGTVTVSANGSVNLQFATTGGTLTVIGSTLELIPIPA